MIFFHKCKKMAWFFHFCLISFLFYYCFLYNIPNEPFYYRFDRHTGDITIKDIELSNKNKDDLFDAYQIRFNGSSINTSNLVIYYRTLSQIRSLDTSSLKSLDHLFQGSSLDISINHWNVSNVQSMQNTFAYALFFNSPLNKWDVSNVKNMNNMFKHAESFNQSLDQWDVSQVKNMQHMFDNARSFNMPLNKWNVSSVIDMSSMFEFAINFNQDLNQWDVSQVKNMVQMFSYAKKFNSAISNWDVSNVRDMSDMFSGALAFNQPIGNWDVSNVINMENMFRNAISFNQDLSQWCVSQFRKKPEGFDRDTPAWEEKHKPQWGKCPRGEDKKRKR